MDIQIQRLIAGFVSNHGAHAFIGAVFQPSVIDVQRLDRGGLVHIQEGEHIRDPRGYTHLTQMDAGERSRKAVRLRKGDLVKGDVVPRREIVDGRVETAHIAVIRDDGTAAAGQLVRGIRKHHNRDSHLIRGIQQVFADRLLLDQGVIRDQEHIVRKDLLLIVLLRILLALVETVADDS